MRENRWWTLGALAASTLLALGGCGSGGAQPQGDGPPTASGTPGAGSEAVLTIQNFAFSPPNLEVAPGQTVRVRNLDAASHSVTSQSAPGQFTPGAVAGVSFDTGVFTGERTFTIPTSAPRGTVIPYYCTVHKQGMANTGQLTIR